MADAPQIPDEAEVRARWGGFAWTAENAEQAKKVIARYPEGRQQSAVMPLLDLAQRGDEHAGLAADPRDRICRGSARYAVHAGL